MLAMEIHEIHPWHFVTKQKRTSNNSMCKQAISLCMFNRMNVMRLNYIRKSVKLERWRKHRKNPWRLIRLTRDRCFVFMHSPKWTHTTLWVISARREEKKFTCFVQNERMVDKNKRHTAYCLFRLTFSLLFFILSLHIMPEEETFGYILSRTPHVWFVLHFIFMMLCGACKQFRLLFNWWFYYLGLLLGYWETFNELLLATERKRRE